MRNLSVLFAAALTLFASVAAAVESTPFTPQSKTYQIAVTTSASTPVQIAPNAGVTSCYQYAVVNTGSDDAWVAFADTSAGAVPAVATTVTPSDSTLVRAGATAAIVKPGKPYVSAIAASTSTTLNIQCGSGTVLYGTSGSVVSGAVSTTPASPSTAGPTSVTASQCSTLTSLAAQGTVGVQVTGTWTGTLTPSKSVDGTNYVTAKAQGQPVGSTASVTSITANGIYTIDAAGMSSVKVCGNTVSSGTAVVSLRTNTSAETAVDGLSSLAGTAGSPATTVITVQGPTSGGTAVPVSAASLPLPTGASTSANQTSTQAPVAPASATATAAILSACQYNSSGVTFTNGQQGSLQCGPNGGLSVGGSLASGAADSGNPVKIGGKYNSTPITLTDGQRGDFQMDAKGSAKVLLVDGNGATVDTTLPAGVQFVPTSSTTNAMAGSASTAAATNLVLKASGGNLYSAYLVNDTAAKIYFMVFNATSLPANGAVTPRHCIAVAANTTSSIDFGGSPMESYSTGITLGSSSTGCFTLTATNASFLYGRVQ